MLTVKHVTDDGNESVVSVDSVAFDRDANCLIGLAPNGVEFIRWTSGHAYVMNENGKTVSVYNITMKIGTVEPKDSVTQLGQARASVVK